MVFRKFKPGTRDCSMFRRRIFKIGAPANGHTKSRPILFKRTEFH